MEKRGEEVYTMHYAGEHTGGLFMNTNKMLLSALPPLVTMVFIGCSGVRPANLGVRDGRLALCPSSPNCVSSQSPDPEHAIDPLQYTGQLMEAKARLKEIIRNMKRASITDESDDYVRAEFTSALFRFRDDVEFWFDDHAKIVHVRSASRVGRSDLGVNRTRVEEIRERWKAAEK
jgi:uncharacterized protein (DUF1499 family)